MRSARKERRDADLGEDLAAALNRNFDIHTEGFENIEAARSTGCSAIAMLRNGNAGTRNHERGGR